MSQSGSHDLQHSSQRAGIYLENTCAQYSLGKRTSYFACDLVNNIKNIVNRSNV